MDNSCNWEKKTLVSELIQGMELAKQLRLHLNTASSVEIRDSLVQRILSSYEKSLLILNWSGSMGQQQNVGATVGIVPESPISMNGSPGSDDFDGGHSAFSKKRKTMPRWTDQVRVSSENGPEGPHEDGYSWRKYGQKDILGTKHPRSYYRCTYRNSQNCWATKQVQRSDEDPTIFDVTYRGTHTCSHGQHSVPPPASPEKQEQKQNINQQLQSQEALFNFQKSLRVNTEEDDNKEIAVPFSFSPTYGSIKSSGTYSPSFISPATPEPNYYVSPFQMANFAGVQNLQHHSESDFAEIISANTSAANSPIVEPDFSLQALELDPNFPFDIPEFFS